MTTNHKPVRQGTRRAPASSAPTAPEHRGGLPRQTVHTPSADEYGIAPTAGVSKVRMLTRITDPTTGADTGRVNVSPPCPTDLWLVCPNMPTVALFTTDDPDVDVWVFDGTTADLAAWKATRTKRFDVPRYNVELRAPSAVDHSQSNAAHKAWETRRKMATGRALLAAYGVPDQ